MGEKKKDTASSTLGLPSCFCYYFFFFCLNLRVLRIFFYSSVAVRRRHHRRTAESIQETSGQKQCVLFCFSCFYSAIWIKGCKIWFLVLDVNPKSYDMMFWYDIRHDFVWTCCPSIWGEGGSQLNFIKKGSTCFCPSICQSYKGMCHTV